LTSKAAEFGYPQAFFALKNSVDKYVKFEKYENIFDFCRPTGYPQKISSSY